MIPMAPTPNPNPNGVSAVVHLSTQQMELVDANGAVLHEFPISSGRDGLTPVGNFNVQPKSDLAYSSSDYPDGRCRRQGRV